MTMRQCFRMRLLVSVVALLVVVQPLVLAQVTAGRSVGVVTALSGAAVPGATVTISQAETAASITITTDDTGSYNATALKIGTYTVSVEKQGFQRVVQSNINLGI